MIWGILGVCARLGGTSNGMALAINHQRRRGNYVGGSAIIGMKEGNSQAPMVLEMVGSGMVDAAACSAAGIVISAKAFVIVLFWI